MHLPHKFSRSIVTINYTTVDYAISIVAVLFFVTNELKKLKLSIVKLGIVV